MDGYGRNMETPSDLTSMRQGSNAAGHVHTSRDSREALLRRSSSCLWCSEAQSEYPNDKNHGSNRSLWIQQNPTQAASEYELWLVMAFMALSFALKKVRQRYSQTVRPPGPTSTLESMDVASKSRGRGVRRCHAAFVDAADGDGIIETWIILNGDKLRNLPRGEPLNLHNIWTSLWLYLNWAQSIPSVKVGHFLRDSQGVTNDTQVPQVPIFGDAALGKMLPAKLRTEKWFSETLVLFWRQNRTFSLAYFGGCPDFCSFGPMCCMAENVISMCCILEQFPL